MVVLIVALSACTTHEKKEIFQGSSAEEVCSQDNASQLCEMKTRLKVSDEIESHPIPQKYIDNVNNLLASHLSPELLKDTVNIWMKTNAKYAEPPVYGEPFYVFTYRINMSRYVNQRSAYFNGSPAAWYIDIEYDKNGLRKAEPLVNCNTNPEYCPPYNISTYRDAFRVHYDKCNCTIPSEYADFDLIEYSKDRYRPAWVLKDERIVGTYKGMPEFGFINEVMIDPQTGDVVHDIYGR